MQTENFERELQGPIDGKRILDGHAAHLRASIDRAFREFPLSPAERKKIVFGAFDRAEGATRAFASLSLQERLLLLRVEGDAVNANAEGDREAVIQSADTFIEICRQAVERVEK